MSVLRFFKFFGKSIRIIKVVNRRVKSDNIKSEVIFNMISVDRRLFIAVDAETAATDADASTEYHIPHVHVSTGLRGVLLLERCHVFHCQNRRFPPLQLFVSTVRQFFFARFPLPFAPRKRDSWHSWKTIGVQGIRCFAIRVSLYHVPPVYLLLPLENRV